MELTALLLGLAGSLHCAGMCSPLSYAITARSKKGFNSFLFYHSGRILMYGLLGSIITVFGFLLHLTSIQNLMSLLLGITLIIAGILGITGFRVPLITPLLERLTIQLKLRFSKLLAVRSGIAILGMGMINGLLPCGLTYLALTYTLVLQGPSDGFLFMILFGIGTLPVMMGIQPALTWIGTRFKLVPSKLTRYAWILIGALLIVRVYMIQDHPLHAEAGIIETLCGPFN